MNKTLFMTFLSISAPLFATTKQTCKLSSYDGSVRTGTIISSQKEIWIEFKGKSELWALKMDHLSGLYIFKNHELFDSINVYDSVREDLKSMRSAVEEMQMYLSTSSWWIKKFSSKAKTALPRKLLSGLSFSISPNPGEAKQKNHFSVSFKPSEHLPKAPLSLQKKSKVMTKVQPKLVFTASAASEKVSKEWWAKDYVPKSIVWKKTEKVKNELKCDKPKKSEKKSVVGSYKKLGAAKEAKKNFLQLVHAQALASVVQHLSGGRGEEAASNLLTGICAKHLLSTSNQLDERKKKNPKVANDKNLMQVVGREFGAAVSVEFKAYQPVVEQYIDKKKMLQIFLNHCTDPLGVLVEAYKKGP